MLLELAIGDAYGMGFEYVDQRTVRLFNDLSAFRRHPKWFLPAGHYTDDTQMSIAVTEALISGEPLIKETFVKYFLQTFHRDPREGYSQKFYDFLSTTTEVSDFLACIDSTSDKSGGAMRAPPIGVLKDTSEVIHVAALQASVTHDTEDGRSSAVAAALMTHYFLYDLGPKTELPAFLERSTGRKWPRWEGRVLDKGWMPVQAALTAILDNDTFSGTLIDCIDFGGDVDTTAAIAMAAVSCSKEFCQNIPDELYSNLENQEYGRDYIIELDRKLFSITSR